MSSQHINCHYDVTSCLPLVHREGSGDLMSFRVLSVANQTDGCKSLSYLILLSTSLVPKPNQQKKGLVTKARILVLKLCNFRWRINKCFVLKNHKFLAAKFQYFYLLLHYILSRKPDPLPEKEKGLVKCVYKLCPTVLYSAVQSHCSILSHDALHDYLSSNSSLENGERKLGHLFRYCRSCKNTTLRGERAYSATGKFKSALFDIWLRHPANCIPVGHGLYT